MMVRKVAILPRMQPSGRQETAGFRASNSGLVTARFSERFTRWDEWRKKPVSWCDAEHRHLAKT